MNALAKEVIKGIGRGLLIGAVILAAIKWPPGVPPPPLHASTVTHTAAPRFANLGGVDASEDVRKLANWIAESNDASGAAFVIVDKRDAKAYVFGADARLRGWSRI